MNTIGVGRPHLESQQYCQDGTCKQIKQKNTIEAMVVRYSQKGYKGAETR